MYDIHSVAVPEFNNRTADVARLGMRAVAHFIRERI